MEVLKLKIFIKQLSKTAGPFVFHCSFCLFKLSLGAKAVRGNENCFSFLLALSL